MKRFLLILVILLSFVIPANADLQLLGEDSLGNRLIYDTDFHITWYDSPTPWQNRKNWAEAMNWADDLSVNFLGNIYSDWRLPRTRDHEGSGCWGYNCTGSEMGHLFYTELENTGAFDTSDNPTGCGLNYEVPTCLTNTSHFQYLWSTFYWSDRKIYYDGGYRFDFRTGIQDNSSGFYSVLAVMDGLAIPSDAHPYDAHPYDANKDWIIGDFELLRAIDDWASGLLGDFELLNLIDYWAAGCYRWDAVAGSYKAGC